MVVGGWTGQYQRLKSAEAFELSAAGAAGRWVPLPDMAAARGAPAVAATPDGNLFVCGGSGAARLLRLCRRRAARRAACRARTRPLSCPSAGLSSTELYLAGEQRWVALPDMLAERSGARAVLLAGGSILVIGGAGDSGTDILSSVEVYLPAAAAAAGTPSVYATGTWEARASLAEARVNFGAAAVAGGSLAVAAGGEGGGLGNILQSVELYEPAADRWTVLPPMPVQRYGLACAATVPTAGGSWGLVVAGGYGGRSELEPPAEEVPPPGPAVSVAAKAVLPGGFAMGGGGGGGSKAANKDRRGGVGCACCSYFAGAPDADAGARGRHLHSTDVYEHVPGGESTWGAGPWTLVAARKSVADCVVPGADGGKLLVLGGIDSKGKTVATAECYGGDDLPPLGTGRNCFGAAVIGPLAAAVVALPAAGDDSWGSFFGGAGGGAQPAVQAPDAAAAAAESKQCLQCGERLGLVRCGRCKAVWYCGKQCQTASWKAGHKADCNLPPPTAELEDDDDDESSAGRDMDEVD